MAVPTNLSQALALLTASSGNKISGLDLREVVTWLASLGLTEEHVETLIAAAADAADAASLAYRSQATWYLDATNGDDDNDGLTAETAIATQAEWLRRTGGAPLVAQTINILSDTSEAMTWRIKNTADTLVTVVGAKSAPLYSGTISAIQNHSSSQNVDGRLTDSGLTGEWMASGLLGKVVVLTSGTWPGWHFWLCSDLGSKTCRFSRVNNGQGAILQATPSVGNTYTVHSLRTLSGKHHIEGGSIKFVDLELGSISGGADQVRVSGGEATFWNSKLFFPRFEGTARVTAHDCWLQDSGSTGVGIYDTADVVGQYTHLTHGATVHGSGRLYSHSITTHGRVRLAAPGGRLYVTNSMGWHDCVNGIEMAAFTTAHLYGRVWGTSVTGVGLTMAEGARVSSVYPITIATVTTQISIVGETKLYSEVPYVQENTGAMIVQAT